MKFPNFAKFFLLGNVSVVVSLLLFYTSISNAANGHTDDGNEEGVMVHHIFVKAIEQFMNSFAQPEDPDSSGSSSRSRRQLYLTYTNVAHILREIEEKVIDNFFMSNGNKIEIK